jgi:putative ribosome biogenesis GTPase RsgA
MSAIYTTYLFQMSPYRSEPGCAVLKALRSGEISEHRCVLRYQSYIRLREGD